MAVKNKTEANKKSGKRKGRQKRILWFKLRARNNNFAKMQEHKKLNNKKEKKSIVI